MFPDALGRPEITPHDWIAHHASQLVGPPESVCACTSAVIGLVVDRISWNRSARQGVLRLGIGRCDGRKNSCVSIRSSLFAEVCQGPGGGAARPVLQRREVSVDDWRLHGRDTAPRHASSHTRGRRPRRRRRAAAEAAGMVAVEADMVAAAADTVAADTSRALADMAAGLAGTAADPSVRRILAGRTSVARILRLIQSEAAVSPARRISAGRAWDERALQVVLSEAVVRSVPDSARAI